MGHVCGLGIALGLTQKYSTAISVSMSLTGLLVGH